MSISPSVSQILRNHVTLEVEGIDRMYLNVYVPYLQTDFGVANFFRKHRKCLVASSALMAPMTEHFIRDIDAFKRAYKIPMIEFHKGERKDDIAQRYLARFKKREGIVFIGKAQEKASVFRTERKLNPATGRKAPWIVRSTAMVNHFYFYGLDKDFGPFFIKFCSYFPYNAKLYLNGHEYVKRQLAQEGIPFKALDNGVLSCANPKRLQALCDGLTEHQINALRRKWLAILPHPFTPEDARAGYRYDISILQAEFSLTQVLDRPLTGRIFFEQVIRENLDIGRPDHIQLLFNRRVQSNTPGHFRTRVITEGVTPSLHVDYKHTRIKQYHKEGRALRTETTINNTRDFAIGKRLFNLPALRAIGFQANRRLLDVQTISHDCAIGEDAFHQVTQPIVVKDQRAPALRFPDARVQALFQALTLFRLLPHGFSNQTLREHLAALQGQVPNAFPRGRMTYDLRRLRLHGLIDRIPKTHRYQVTDFGLRTALFFTRTYARILRPGLSNVMSKTIHAPLRDSFDQLDATIKTFVQEAQLAA